MELTTEIIEANSLSAEQVTAINTLISSSSTADEVAEIKKEYGGKANEQAEGILTGASKAIAELTNVPRNQGEKVADYMARSFNVLSSEGNEALKVKQLEYEDKVKNFKGDPEVAKQILDLKDKLDGLQKKEAEYDTLLGSGVQDKYNALKEKTAAQDKLIAFNGVKPTFDKDANEYEVNSKWGAFQDEVLTKYDIVLVEGEAIAVDKDNEHKTIKLKDLVASNNVLTELTKGRQQSGIGAQQTDSKEVAGVPFRVPISNSNGELSKAVQEQLTKEGINKLDSNYSKRFSELHTLALKTA